MDRYLARLLPPNEWHRLGLAPEHLPRDPDRAVVMVVEDENGTICGRWLAYDTTVLEGLWIAPEHRTHPGVAGRLMQAMTAELAGRMVPMAITLITDPAVAMLARHAGLYETEGQLWVLDLRHLIEAMALSAQPRFDDDEGG
jgi:hypothetical protein